MQTANEQLDPDPRGHVQTMPGSQQSEGDVDPGEQNEPLSARHDALPSQSGSQSQPMSQVNAPPSHAHVGAVPTH